MLRKSWICICLLIIVPGLLFTTSCAKKAVHTEQRIEEAEPAAEETASQQTQEMETEKQAEESQTSGQLTDQTAKEDQAQDTAMVSKLVMNDDIYFDFDSAVLRETARDILIRKADWIKVNPEVSVIIEGHCDQRGTSAYNIALGDRRAQSAKAFFVDLGIDPNQLATISYGEERPADTGQNEEAWAKNRRAHFVVE